jgi:hypothetical protein
VSQGITMVNLLTDALEETAQRVTASLAFSDFITLTAQHDREAT